MNDFSSLIMPHCCSASPLFIRITFLCTLWQTIIIIQNKDNRVWKTFFLMRLHSCSWWESSSCLLLKELSDKGSGFYLMKRARKSFAGKTVNELTENCINLTALSAELSVFKQMQRKKSLIVLTTQKIFYAVSLSFAAVLNSQRKSISSGSPGSWVDSGLDKGKLCTLIITNHWGK